MMSSSGKIVLAIGVYDNADTLRQFLEWHLHVGVDFVEAYDYGSTDGSQDILDEYSRRGVLSWRVIPDMRYSQFDPFDNIALIAADRGADWIIVCDADEFLCVEGNGLKALLRNEQSRGAGVVVVKRNNMTGPPPPWPYDAALGALTLRIDQTFPVTPMNRVFGVLPGPAIFAPQPPKVLVQSAGLKKIGPGAHSAESLGRTARTNRLRFLHYPTRGYGPFEAKVINISNWLKQNSDLGGNFAWHWKRLVRLYRDRRLYEEYLQQFISDDEAQNLVDSGICSYDHTLANWVKKVPSRYCQGAAHS